MMKYAIRLKEDKRFGEWSGMYLTEQSLTGDIKVRKFDSYEEAKNFLDGLYKNTNWEVVEFIEE